MQLALYQPEIPQNTGTLLRLAACLDIAVDIIEPCSFVLSDRRMRRAGMDYLDYVKITRHSSWEAFHSSITTRRLILLSPKGATPYTNFDFKADDVVMVGKESTGVPEEVFAATSKQLYIPVRPECRSLNVAVAAAMVIGEALRQTR